MSEQFESIIQIFPVHIREQAGQALNQLPMLEEIRIRIGKNIALLSEGQCYYLCEKQNTHEKEKLYTREREQAYVVTEQDMQEFVTFLSSYSPYAFVEEIRNGYLTIEGGHRVGLAGQVRMREKQVADIPYIRFLNIRVAREHKDCAKEVMSHIRRENSIFNTLILSPPGIGKSTCLRDCIRQLSDTGIRIGLVDERSEIAACHMGVPQNDVGRCTDVMDRCSKPAGMQMLLRSMSPNVLAVDELGGADDFEAVEQAFHCGCKILGTIHAGSIEELTEKKILRKWVESGWFERYVLLNRDAAGRRGFHVYNERLEQIC